MRTDRNILALGAVMAASAGVMPAMAQDATGARPEQGTTYDAGEIVVTAQRREQTLSDVPMSVTAISGAQLEASGVQTTQDLTLVTPGLVLARSSSYFQPTIRGIGNRNSGPGDEPNVATYIDGVYQAEQSATLMELSNIERIEVLKGPQGTLFGRNATGGAINILTRKPTAEPHMAFSATFGEYEYIKATAYASGAITNGISANISAVGLRDDGYIKNVLLNTTQGKRRAYAARVRTLFEVSERVEFQLNGLYSYNSDNSAFSGFSLNGNNRGRRAPYNNLPIPESIAFPTGPYTTATSFIPVNNVESGMVDAHLEVDMGFATLQAIAAYSKSHLYTNSDVDASPYDIFTNVNNIRGEAFYEDILISSNSEGRFEWLAGATFFQGKSYQDPQFLNAGKFFGGQKTNSYAFFGEGTWEAIDNLFLTGGLRYSSDKKTARAVNLNTGVEVPARSKTFSDLSPRAVIRYEFAPDSNVYASYAQGYKTGTFNTSSGVITGPADAENVEAFEAGIKLRLAPGLNFSAAAFRYDYTDLQVTVIIPSTGSALQTALQNADAARVTGAEATFNYSPMRNLNLFVSGSLLDSKFTDFADAAVTVPVLLPDGTPAGSNNVLADVKGNELIRAPDWTISVGGTYGVEMGAGTLEFAANALFSDNYYVDVGNRVQQPAYTVVNGSITFRLDSGLSVGVFGQNLTDERYFRTNTISTISDTAGFEKPRWFGVRLGAEL